MPPGVRDVRRPASIEAQGLVELALLEETFGSKCPLHLPGRTRFEALGRIFPALENPLNDPPLNDVQIALDQAAFELPTLLDRVENQVPKVDTLLDRFHLPVKEPIHFRSHTPQPDPGFLGHLVPRACRTLARTPHSVGSGGSLRPPSDRVKRRQLHTKQ